jgi:hypothetical protein
MVAVTGWRLWPEWLKYRERSEIKAKVKKLTLQNYDRETDAVFKKGDRDQTYTVYGIEFSTHFQRFDWYCVVAQSVPVPGKPNVSRVRALRVYRLENPPARYEPQTEGGRAMLRQFDVKGPDDPVWRCAYFADFISMINGNTKEELGITYKLIHTDPPDDDN